MRVSRNAEHVEWVARLEPAGNGSGDLAWTRAESRAIREDFLARCATDSTATIWYGQGHSVLYDGGLWRNDPPPWAPTI